MLLPVAVTVAAMIALLAAERWEVRPGVWAAKPLASTGFLATAVAAGALENVYGQTVFVALLLSWLGDVLLIPRGGGAWFRAGLGSFLLGHVAFSVAFGVRGLDPLVCALATLLLAAPAALALRWLRPHVPAAMRGPVWAYVAVISIMVVLAASTVGAQGRPLIAVGAAAFYVSDLAVARQRFVVRDFRNKLWGLPLYYGGQLLLAATSG
jgi:uncharacterized membrane protein YhhN